MFIFADDDDEEDNTLMKILDIQAIYMSRRAEGKGFVFHSQPTDAASAGVL